MFSLVNSRLSNWVMCPTSKTFGAFSVSLERLKFIKNKLPQYTPLLNLTRMISDTGIELRATYIYTFEARSIVQTYLVLFSQPTK